jgi:asparagine synthase (glutamine-hydrolysing)
MCGILGTVNVPFDQSGLDRIRHRGPDGSGISQTSMGNHLVTLGHRRLSILDLSPAGHQPMWTRSRRHAIVFNGEIYNHQELRAELDYVEYRGHSDTETILHCLASRGIRAAERFNGIFTFCLADFDARRLFLARDGFGVKPLYYRCDGRTLVFSSELRGIRQFFDDPLDVDNLAELLRLRYLPAPDTLFKNVYKLRPGHVAEVDLTGHQVRVREYPYLRSWIRSAPIRDRGDAIEQYGSLVNRAVARQLLSDVEVGVLLSGGIDSAMVATLAQRAAPYKIKAFTVGFSEASAADEVAEAAETARLAGLEHHVVRLGLRDFLELLPSINSIIEEPLATTSIIPMFSLAKLASSHVKVVLSGQGADETMGGYRRYQIELVRNFIPKVAVPALRKLAAMARVKSDSILRGLESVAEPDDVRRFENVYSVFSRDQIGRLIGRNNARATERIAYFFNLLRCNEQARSVERMMNLDARMNLADDLLLYTDKITMHHSLECRVPLLDLDLVRFVESLPYRYRVGLGSGKRIHKWHAARILPASILNRRKKGFLSPTARWFKAQGAMRDVLLDRTSPFSTYFNLREVEKVLTDHQAGWNRERHIFLLLSLSYWMRDFLPSKTPPFGYALAV